MIKSHAFLLVRKYFDHKPNNICSSNVFTITMLYFIFSTYIERGIIKKTNDKERDRWRKERESERGRERKRERVKENESEGDKNK